MPTQLPLSTEAEISSQKQYQLYPSSALLGQSCLGAFSQVTAPQKLPKPPPCIPLS